MFKKIKNIDFKANSESYSKLHPFRSLQSVDVRMRNNMLFFGNKIAQILNISRHRYQLPICPDQSSISLESTFYLALHKEIPNLKNKKITLN